jgi:hypothetical protein
VALCSGDNRLILRIRTPSYGLGNRRILTVVGRSSINRPYDRSRVHATHFLNTDDNFTDVLHAPVHGQLDHPTALSERIIRYCQKGIGSARVREGPRCARVHVRDTDPRLMSLNEAARIDCDDSLSMLPVCLSAAQPIEAFLVQPKEHPTIQQLKPFSNGHSFEAFL